MGEAVHDLFDWIMRNQNHLAGDIGDDVIERAIEAEGLKSGQTLLEDAAELRRRLTGSSALAGPSMFTRNR